jgi:hypothetical protein
MASSGYKESAADKAARQRERRIASANAADAASEEAAGLTSDLRAIYGMRGMLGQRAPGTATAAKPASTVKMGFAGNTIAPTPATIWNILAAGKMK